MTTNGTDWRVHLDGFDLLPFLSGERDEGPRDQIFYFAQGGDLNTVGWNDWKVHFARLDGNIEGGVRIVAGWPVIINLRADPYKKMWHESDMHLRWMGGIM